MVFDDNKVAKNIVLIYKAKPYLNKDSLLALYFSYIHPFINYVNLVCGSTNRTYLRKINSQQKHALILIYNINIFYHSKELFKSCEILSAYKLNLLNTLKKKKNRTAPSLFLEKLKQPAHSYPTRFSSGNYRKPQFKLYANVDFKFPLEVRQYGTT